MRSKEFDYYIFVDYSEDWVGYTIIESLYQESCLKRGSVECRLSYIIDNLLNLRRRNDV